MDIKIAAIDVIEVNFGDLGLDNGHVSYKTMASVQPHHDYY